MADTDHTLGHRFAGSKFFAKTVTSHLIDPFMVNNEPDIKSGNPTSPYSGSSHIINSPVLDNTLAELMENLRLHVHDMLHLPLSVQTRSRLVRLYCDIESQVKEMRLLLNPVDLNAALELLAQMQTQPGTAQSGKPNPP